MSCKPRRTLNSAACIVPLYYWYEDAAVYKEFFKSKQWQEYVRKQALKNKIKERCVAYMLTPQGSKYLAEFCTDLPDAMILSSEIDLILDALDDMYGKFGSAAHILLYISQIPLKTSPRQWLDPSVMNEVLNSLNPIFEKHMEKSISQTIPKVWSYGKSIKDIQGEIGKIVEKDLKGLQREMGKIVEKELDNNICWEDAEKTYLKYVENADWYSNAECIGSLSKNSKGYFLDGIRIGNRVDMKRKISYCLKLLDREHPTLQQLKINSSICCLYLDLTHPTPQQIIKRIINRVIKAAKLTEEIMGKETFEELLRNGHIRVKSKAGGEYKIDINGDVFSFPHNRYVCLMVDALEPVPLFDEILAKYFFIKDKESHKEEIAEDFIIGEASVNQELYELLSAIDCQEEFEARKNASYDIDSDGRIVDISLEEQGERVN